MSIAYQYTANGYYAGSIEDYGFLPNNSTYTPVLDDKKGFIQKWNSDINNWEYIENHKGESGYLNGKHFEVKEYGPLPDKFQTNEEWEAGRLDRLLEDISKAKNEIVSGIDRQVSNNILSGFDYQYQDKELHFSYDAFDQQNFADTANACLLLKINNSDNDKTITWNAYDKDSNLVRLELSANEFLDLYNSALDNKKKLMMLAGQRKAMIRDAQSSDELKSLIKEWNINL